MARLESYAQERVGEDYQHGDRGKPPGRGQDVIEPHVHDFKFIGSNGFQVGLVAFVTCGFFVYLDGKVELLHGKVGALRNAVFLKLFELNELLFVILVVMVGDRLAGALRRRLNVDGHVAVGTAVRRTVDAGIGLIAPHRDRDKRVVIVADLIAVQVLPALEKVLRIKLYRITLADICRTDAARILIFGAADSFLHCRAGYS